MILTKLSHRLSAGMVGPDNRVFFWRYGASWKAPGLRPQEGADVRRAPSAKIDGCWVDRTTDVLTVTGDVGEENIAAFTEQVVAAVTAGVTHLDLSGVSFFSAAGVRAVLAGHQLLPAQVTALQVTCSPVVLRVVQACGLVGAGRLRIVAAEHLPQQRSPRS
jgi:anti-anti-sigma factor